MSELVLEVVDLERAIRFYTEDLGLPLVERWQHREAAWVMVGERTQLGLWRPQVGLAEGRGGVHVTSPCTSTMPGTTGSWHSRECGHEVEEHVFDTYEESVPPALEADPDGNVVEFWTWDVGNHLRPQRKAAERLVTQCCRGASAAHVECRR